MRNLFYFTLTLVTVITVLSCERREETIQPTACFTASPENIFLGETVEFTNCSQDAQSYLWDFGDNNKSDAENTTHKFTDPGEYSVVLTASNKELSDKATKTIYVTLKLNITTTIITDITTSTATTGGEVLTNGGSAITARGVCYSKNPKPTTANIKTINGAGIGTFISRLTGLQANTKYYVRAYVTNSSSTAYGEELTFLTSTTTGIAPVAAFTADKTIIKENETVTFTDNSTNAPTSWNWTFGDGSSSSTEQNPSHTYSTTGSYTVSLTATNSSGSDAEIKLNYIIATASGTEPIANFSANNTDITAGEKVIFTDNSTNTPTSWSWNFGDNSSSSAEQNPIHVYSTPGIYTVSLTATNSSGKDTKVKLNYIIATAPALAPVADFKADATSIIEGDQVVFIDMSTNTPTSWNWNFGDGSSSSAEQNPIHVYSTPGIYTVSLTATNISGNDIEIKSNFIIVTASVLAPVADFKADNTNITQGNQIAFTDMSTNTPTSWNWNFGDGSSSSAEQNPIHVYSTPGIYTVSLTATNTFGYNTVSKSNYITVTAGGDITVKDFDGNIYNTVTIGSQTWMAEDLRVTHETDGKIIIKPSDLNSNGSSNDEWALLSDDNDHKAYCYYNNDISNGVLYTYAAAKDVCPAGWHLPTDAEWTELISYITSSSSYGEIEGKALKSTTRWYNGGVGDDFYGFNALPSGSRDFSTGAFSIKDNECRFWSNTENGGTNTYARGMFYNYSTVTRYSGNKSNGYSVRCVMD